MTELKPCPFCGSGDQLRVLENDHGWPVVWCDGCRAQGPDASTDDDAIAAWNERAEG